MELLQLKYFQVIAQHEHMTQAANILSVSQPSLSATLSKLEDELGFQLFDRQGRNIRLNDYGRIFLRHTNAIFQELNDAQLAMNDLQQVSFQSVAIGVSTIMLLDNWLMEFADQYPTLKISQKLAANDILKKDLLNNNIDFALTFMPLKDERLTSVTLYEDEMLLLVPFNHPLAIYDEINLSQAANERFIGQYNDVTTNRMTDDLCAAAGFRPNYIFQGDINIAWQFALREHGIIIALKSTERTCLKSLKIKTPDSKITITMSWLKGRYMSDALQDLKKYVIDFYTQRGVELNNPSVFAAW